MRDPNPLMIIFCVFILSFFILFVVFVATPCSAQLWSPYPWIIPFAPVFYPFNPPLPLSLPFFRAADPLLPPYIAGLPMWTRNANATIIIILNQTANTVTASAPLGTVNLTSSAVVPLSLFLAL